MITTAECIKRYGQPNEGGVGYLESISLPYPMVYDGKPVNKMRCHRLVKQNFLDVFNQQAGAIQDIQERNAGIVVNEYKPNSPYTTPSA